MLLIQTQSRQRQLLPEGVQRERVSRSTSLLLPWAPAVGCRAYPSPFFPPAIPCVPEALGKRVVVDLQLCNLRGTRKVVLGQDLALSVWPGAPRGQRLPQPQSGDQGIWFPPTWYGMPGGEATRRAWRKATGSRLLKNKNCSRNNPSTCSHRPKAVRTELKLAQASKQAHAVTQVKIFGT